MTWDMVTKTPAAGATFFDWSEVIMQLGVLDEKLGTGSFGPNDHPQAQRALFLVLGIEAKLRGI